MPVPDCEMRWSHWYGPSTVPPWHEPTLPQLRRCWTERLMSMPLPLRAILMRSPRAEMEPWAQHEPQYCGMCWLRDIVHRPWSHQEKAEGRSSVLSVSCGSGDTVWLPRQTTPSASVASRPSTSDGLMGATSAAGATTARAAVMER
jgi:hypothetical protein